MCRGEDRKPITTEYSGELDVQQIVDVGCAWWSCDGLNGECESKSFDMLQKGWIWKCRECGKEGSTIV